MKLELAPRRVAFVAPLIRGSSRTGDLTPFVARIWECITYNYLLTHRQLGINDVEDSDLLHGDEVLDAEHPSFSQLVESLFDSDRRDEVLWFEFDLTAQSSLRLTCLSSDGRREQFAALGRGPNSEQVESCLHQWLSARQLQMPTRDPEPFGLDELLNAANALAQTRKAEDGSVDFFPPNQLQLSFWLAAYKYGGLYTYRQALELAPECPWALRHRYLATRHMDGPNDTAAILRAVEVAPLFAKGHMSAADAVGDKTLGLHHAALGAYLFPRNPYSSQIYSFYLGRTGRWDEGWSVMEHACSQAPAQIEMHIRAVNVLRSLGRPGRRLEVAQHHRAFVHHLVEQGALATNHVDFGRMEVVYSSALVEVGRLPEAIELHQQAVARFPMFETETLEKWKSDPSYLAQACLREGHFRGDPGVVREALGAAPLDGAIDLSMAIDADIALGREDRAAALYALHWERKETANPAPAARGAKALALLGEVRLALIRLQERALGFPRSGWQSEETRTLRLLTCSAFEPWRQLIETTAEEGGERMACVLARDAADFHPEAVQHPEVARLAQGKSHGELHYSSELFAELRESLRGVELADIDAFFEGHESPDLATADRLASRWSGLIDRRAVPAEDPEAMQQFQGRVLWALAQALGRYLALTTREPNVLAGGYRQMLDGLLEVARGVLNQDFDRRGVWGLLAGLERCAARVDEWWLDRWLLRLEAALHLEFACDGRFERVAEGLPKMLELLRGTERVGVELRAAHLLQQSGDDDATGVWLAERCFRATGCRAANDWAKLAERALPPKQALDVANSCVWGCSFSGNVSRVAGRLALQVGKPRAAFDLLNRRLSNGGEEWLQQVVAEFEPLWSSEMPAPLRFEGAAQAGQEALAAGDYARAVDCYRWLTSIDPANTQTWHYLGIALARAGHFHEALAAFGCANHEAGSQMAANEWAAHHQFAEAALALEATSGWFRSVEPWAMLGYCAGQAERRELAVRAYDEASKYGPLPDPSHDLLQVALLGELGDYEGMGHALVGVEGRHGNDPDWASQIHLHKAVYLMGVHRFSEALAELQQAAAKNRHPENQGVIEQTTRLAQLGKTEPTVPRRDASGAPRLFHLLEQAEFHELMKIEPADCSWKERRALFRAARFRFESENDQAVTGRAWNLAAGLISASHGTIELDAALCRTEAFKVREDWMFPVDTPARLGVRPDRQQMRQRCFPAGEMSHREKLDVYGQAAQAVANGQGGDPDPEVFPGGPLPRLSDYVSVMKGMQSGDPMGALASYGIDMMSYGQIAMDWGQAMQSDPTLSAKFTKMMSD